MDSRNSKKQLKKDIEFLDEMNEAAEKWRDGSDWSSRDLLFQLIKDWKNELNERIKLCE